MVLATAGVLGAIQLTPAQAQAIKPVDSPKEVKENQAARPENGKGRVFHLQVVSADTGKPASNADVRVFIAHGDYYRKTDAQGRLDIVYSTGPADTSFCIDVWGDGLAMQRGFWGDSNKPIPDGDTVKLHPGETLGGIVKDEQGRPISARKYCFGVTITSGKTRANCSSTFAPSPVSMVVGKPRALRKRPANCLPFASIIPTTSAIETTGCARKSPRSPICAGKAEAVLEKGAPINGRVLDLEGKPVAGARVLSTSHDYFLYNNVARYAVTTDADGRFRAGQFWPGEYSLIATAKGHSPGATRLKVNGTAQQVEVRLGKPRVFKARVLDPAGKPIEGAFVNIDTWQGYRCLGVFLYTDADGRVRWDDAPDDFLVMNVHQEGYRGVNHE